MRSRHAPLTCALPDSCFPISATRSASSARRPASPPSSPSCSRWASGSTSRRSARSTRCFSARRPGIAAPETVRRLDVTMPPTPGQQIFFNNNHSLADVEALRARRETFAALGAYSTGKAAITEGRRPRGRAAEGRTSRSSARDYFEALGVRTALGRAFTAPEHSAFDGAPVVVLSHAYWQRTLRRRPRRRSAARSASTGARSRRRRHAGAVPRRRGHAARICSSRSAWRRRSATRRTSSGSRR